MGQIRPESEHDDDVVRSKHQVVGGRQEKGSAQDRRDLDRVDPEPIVGTVAGGDVFFSPDGRRLGFENADTSELWTAPLDGGTAQRLLPNQPVRGGAWGDDDRIVFARVGSGLWMTSASAGDPPMLLFQGTKDPLVTHDQAIQMAEALTKVGVPGRVELMIGEGHGWPKEHDRVVRATFEFFAKHLKP